MDAIQALSAHDEIPGSAGATAAPVHLQPGASFSRLVSEGLGQLNERLQVSQTDLQQLALGETRNLHEVMIRLEESRISFQLMLQVRNRALEAYQEVMRMQI